MSLFGENMSGLEPVVFSKNLSERSNAFTLWSSNVPQQSLDIPWSDLIEQKQCLSCSDQLPRMRRNAFHLHTSPRTTPPQTIVASQ